MAENIVKEIKEKLIPYAKIIDLEQEEKEEEERQREKGVALEKKDKIEEITEENKKEEFKKAKEELLGKLRSAIASQEIASGAPRNDEQDPISTKNPGVVKPTISNVEENAKNMIFEGKNMTTKESQQPAQTPPPGNSHR